MTREGKQHWELGRRIEGAIGRRAGLWHPSYLGHKLQVTCFAGNRGDNLLLIPRLNYCCDDSGTATSRGNSGLL